MENEKLLRPIQERAIDFLLSGASVTETAKNLKISRQTVSEWINRCAAFREIYGERRLHNREAITNRLLSLGRKAVAVMDRELDNPKISLQAASLIIRCAESFADHDLREARFQQLTHSELIQDLLGVITRLHKMEDKTLRNFLDRGFDPFAGLRPTSAENGGKNSKTEDPQSR